MNSIMGNKCMISISRRQYEGNFDSVLFISSLSDMSTLGHNCRESGYIQKKYFRCSDRVEIFSCDMILYSNVT